MFKTTRYYSPAPPGSYDYFVPPVYAEYNTPKKPIRPRSASPNPKSKYFYSTTYPDYSTPHTYCTPPPYTLPKPFANDQKSRGDHAHTNAHRTISRSASPKVGSNRRTISPKEVAAEYAECTRYPETPLFPSKPTTPKPAKAAPTTPQPSPKATAADTAKHNIPATYSFKNWDPEESPILLLGNVFDVNSLGKWIYDWTVSNHGSGTPLSETAGDLWLSLLRLTSKMKNPRRGRGKRKNDAYYKSYNADDDNDPFDNRKCLFEGTDGKVTRLALANLDTGLKIPGGLIMSLRYAKELGRHKDISHDFVDPGMRSISGHDTPVTGILRNVTFRLKGASVTFTRDFYVCDVIDDMVDIVAGAHFIKNQFNLLFGKVKAFASTFATWFSTRKEDAKEKEERERREREQQIKANEREIARLQREQQMLRDAQQRISPQSSNSNNS